MRVLWKKRGLSVIMAVVMGTMLFGCGNSSSGNGSESETPKEGTPKAEAETTTSDSGAYVNYSGGFPEQVTIEIPVYERAFANWDATNNYYTRWIQEQFGDKYNVQLKYIAISKTNQVSDFMQLLAAGNAPDILYNTNMSKQVAYYEEGALQELDWDEIAYYAPTYWNNLSDIIQTYGKVEGKPYFFFGERPNSVGSIALIRTDWLEQVGMDMPQNLTELNAVLAAWRDAGLGNGGGFLQQNVFGSEIAFRKWPVSDEDLALYSDVAFAPMPSEAMHDYLKNMNYQYNNDLIDKEFYLNTDETAILQDFISGNAGILTRWNMKGSSTLFDSLLKNNPDAKVGVLPQSANCPEGYPPQSKAGQPYGMIQGINHSTTEEERIAIWMYLEWMSQPENLFFLQNGIEGENYTLDENGLPERVVNFNGESKLSENNNNDYWCLVTQNVKYDDPEQVKAAAIKNDIPLGYGYIAEQAYDDFYSIQEYALPDPLFTVVISSASEYQADLNEKWKELYVRCVMATEDKFEETYEAASKDFLDAGFQKVLEEKKAAFDAGNCIIKR